MIRAHVSLLLPLLLVAGTAATQTPSSLLFSTRKAEFTRTTAGGPSLRALSPSTVAIVEPGGAACLYTAHKFVPGVAFQTMLGDEDGDGDVHTPGVLGAVQNILVKPYEYDFAKKTFSPRTRSITARDIYITPKVAIGTHVSGNPGLRPCDCGAIIADGKIRYFIKGEQIIGALGMVDQERRRLKPTDISLDAITVDSGGNIYVSFEETHLFQFMCNGTLTDYTIQDGAVLRIPSNALRFGPNGNVDWARPNSGYVVMSELFVDSLLKRSKASNVSGNCLTKCIDIDGLAIDPRGGTFQTGFCNFVIPVPNLLFTTEANTGGGVISTRNLGSIARLNACPLANSCANSGKTNGAQLGMKPTGSVGSLEALETESLRVCRFALSTPNAQALDRNCEWRIATNLDVTSVLLYAGNGALPVSPAWDIRTRLGLLTNCFPEVFPNAFTYGPVAVPMKRDGWGGRWGKFGPLPVASSLAPNGLITQVFVFHGGRWQASTPMTFVR